MLFLIDLPLKAGDSVADTSTTFQSSLQRFLQDMGVDDGMIGSLSKYDFSKTRDVGLICSRFV